MRHRSPVTTQSFLTEFVLLLFFSVLCVCVRVCVCLCVCVCVTLREVKRQGILTEGFCCWLSGVLYCSVSEVHSLSAAIPVLGYGVLPSSACQRRRRRRCGGVDGRRRRLERRRDRESKGMSECVCV